MHSMYYSSPAIFYYQNLITFVSAAFVRQCKLEKRTYKELLNNCSQIIRFKIRSVVFRRFRV